MHRKNTVLPSDVSFQAPNAAKPVFSWGSAPKPAGGAYNTPRDLLVGWGGDTLLTSFLPCHLWRL